MTNPASTAAEQLAALREHAPLIQCITNSVVVGVTANALLAIGVAPAMVDVVAEAGVFAPIADGMLVNLGTATAEQREAAREGTRAAHHAGTPWVLDPVAIGALPARTALATEILVHKPTAIRGNASEIMTLAGEATGGRGVDSAHTVEAAEKAADSLATQVGAVVAVSGATDVITDGSRTARVNNGHPLLTRMTGGGCVLGAMITAFLATDHDADAFTAVTSAHAVYGIAAEHAAAQASGPGSFAVALLDALAAIDPDTVTAHAQIEVRPGTNSTDAKDVTS